MKRLGELPVERKNRKPWHERVERAIVQLNGAEMITIRGVLKLAGIEESDAQLWPAARLYAKQLLDGLGTR